ncbi:MULTISPECIES: alpha/beta fold hydrolase [Pseudonocardia]|uniref:4,5:9,10-diseco-3-hydroxy-5,9, 17-trioxoandrosta-1(10),2-diene-4-oate hydrolase n=2 Tax=Pseudonocardia TaxID=1847 RepID=A0A1Y2MJB7_PSEAH|nr:MULTISPECIES: alpha/beta hydrolase [Pseudonocardia]OSY35354.1 4,5:9,10-diseco-3-hydroxy-5,9,17-trioxoandrosta-1(10),2-diene-4-oate hydrolase [Pseudonocardia autotrophica]TDN75480.1 pimeloyl-ACP methyl ester carboxylesterase [Pseudonocardia autotrophica]BBF99446.1 alpha/beta hydrolase [Pseudonocardia autotrophica]GEC28532.1 alpha/beta hydrolase [Pseudonocardia saturnea]
MTLVPAGSGTGTIDIDGGRVRVLRSVTVPEPERAGTPLLLVHGGGTDNAAISWFHAFEAFGVDREVFAIDLPGFGGTTGIDPVGDPRRTADLTARVAARLGLTRVVAVGVSMGGDVVLNLALRHPELVEALVLIGPGGLIPVLRNRFTQFAAWLAAQLPERVLLALSRTANSFVQSAVRGVVSDPDSLPPEVLAEFLREARRPGAFLGYLRYNRATLGPRSMRNDLQSEVGRIDVPALFFHGADDPMVDPEGSRRAARSMPAARLVLVPGCGHWAQLEASEQFAAEVRALLAGTAHPGAA